MPRLRRWWAAALRLRGPLLVIAGVGTVLGGLAGYFNAWRTLGPAAPAAATAPADAEVEPLSILVLPFANQTGNPALAHLADGLTTAVTGDLTRIGGAVVVPAVTAASLGARRLTLAQIGAEARVRYVLQGAVSAQGEQLRIHAQLADTRSGSQLWSQAFDGRLTDVFALQDSVTARIRASVAPQMLVRAAREAETRQQTPKVADLLLRVRALELQDQSLEQLKAIEALSRQVLALEPGNLAARSSLALALDFQASNFVPELGLDSAGRRALRDESLALAQGVLRDDPDDVRMLNTVAFVAWVRGDVDAARRAFERALAADPTYSATYNNIGIMYRDINEQDRAREYLLKSLQMPRYGPRYGVFCNLSIVELRAGRSGEALKWARRCVEGPSPRIDWRTQLVLAQAVHGDVEGARQSAAALLRDVPTFVLRRPRSDLPSPMAWYTRHFETVLEPAARLAGLPVEPPMPR